MPKTQCLHNGTIPLVQAIYESFPRQSASQFNEREWRLTVRYSIIRFRSLTSQIDFGPGSWRPKWEIWAVQQKLVWFNHSSICPCSLACICVIQVVLGREHVAGEAIFQATYVHTRAWHPPFSSLKRTFFWTTGQLTSDDDDDDDRGGISIQIWQQGSKPSLKYGVCTLF